MSAPVAMQGERSSLGDPVWTHRGRHAFGIGETYTSDTGCFAIVTHEPVGWHISVSATGRYPTWDELASIREATTPDDVEMVMVFPRRSEYVNLHKTCLHLYEAPEEE